MYLFILGLFVFFLSFLIIFIELYICLHYKLHMSKSGLARQGREGKILHTQEGN